MRADKLGIPVLVHCVAGALAVVAILLYVVYTRPEKVIRSTSASRALSHKAITHQPAETSKRPANNAGRQSNEQKKSGNRDDSDITPEPPVTSKQDVPSPQNGPPSPKPAEEKEVKPEPSRTSPNPFTRLARQVNFEMPPFGEPEVLLGEFVEADLNWDMEIDNSAALLADFQQFTVVRDSSGQPQWKIMLSAQETDGSSSLPTATRDKEVGYVMVRDHRVILRAIEPRSTPEVAQLRNCILQFRCGDFHHAVQLRNPRRIGTIILGLEQEAIRIPLGIDAVPRTDHLVLEIADIRNFGDGVTTPKTPQTRYLQPEPAEISFPIDVPCGVKVELVGGPTEPIVKVSPYYQILDSNYPLTEKRFRTMLVSLNHECKESVSKEAAYRKRQDKIPGELSHLRSSSPRSNFEREMIGRQVSKLLDEQQKLPIVIKGIVERRPQLEHFMKSVTELGKYATEIKDKATISLRVFAQADTGTIDLLVVASGDLKPR